MTFGSRRRTKWSDQRQVNEGVAITVAQSCPRSSQVSFKRSLNVSLYPGTNLMNVMLV